MGQHFAMLAARVPTVMEKLIVNPVLASSIRMDLNDGPHQPKKIMNYYISLISEIIKPTALHAFTLPDI